MFGAHVQVFAFPVHPVLTVSRKTTKEYEPAGKLEGTADGVCVEAGGGGESVVGLGCVSPPDGIGPVVVSAGELLVLPLLLQRVSDAILVQQKWCLSTLMLHLYAHPS